MHIDIDLRDLTDWQLAEYLVKFRADFEDRGTLELKAAEIMTEVDNGKAVIVAEHSAVAVVRPEGYRAVNGGSVLWLFLVKPSVRGTGIGKRFIMKLRRCFELTEPMILVCNGNDRESFFSACGFRLKERCDDGSAIMVAKIFNKPFA